MFKEPFLPKSPFKYLRGISSVAILFFCILCLIGTTILLIVRWKFEKEFNGHFPGYHLTSGPAFYVFPQHVVIFEIRLSDHASADSTTLLIPMAVFRIPVGTSIKNRQILLQEAAFFRPVIHLEHLTRFYNIHQNAIENWLSRFPIGDFAFSMLAAKTLPSDMILNDSFSGTVRKEGRDFTAEVKINEKAKEGWGIRWLYPPDILKIRMKGILRPGGAVLERIDAERDNFHLQLWGDVQERDIHLQGFGLINLTDPSRNSLTSRWRDILRRDLQFLQRKGPLSPVVQQGASPQEGIYLLDIAGVATVDFPCITVQKINFLLNQFFISSTGQVRLEQGFPMTFDVLIKPKNNPGSFFLDNLRLSLKTKFEHLTTAAMISGQITFGELVGKETRKHLLEFAMPDVRLSRTSGFVWQGRARNNSFRFFLSGEENRIHMALLDGQFGWLNENFFFAESRAEAYQGKIEARFWYNERQQRMTPTVFLQAAHVNLKSLNEGIPALRYIDGFLSSRMFIRPGTAEWLQGEGVIGNGRLHEIAFWDWIAKNFAIPELRNIKFEQANARLSGTAERVGFSNFLIQAPEINISGDFYLKQNGLSEGTVSLDFARHLLEKSSSLTRLMRASPVTDTHFVFDFQLSGQMPAVNFRWLPSPLKTRIQSLIPDFIEQRIETNVERSAAP